jgi:hypothetical protein
MSESKETLWSYHFTGRVHPERTYVTLDGLSFRVEVPPLGLIGNLTLSILEGQLSINISCGSEIQDLSSLRNVAQSFAQNLVDVLGYTWGRAYEVEITAVLPSNGRHLVFGVGDAVLENAVVDRPLPIEDLLPLSASNIWLRRALGELRRSISEPDDTGFHCQRAIESLRRHFQEEKSEKHGWQAMRRALNLSEETLKILNEFGDPQRHGDVILMTYDMRTRDMSLAWKVVDRFVVLLHRAEKGLPMDEFPVL